ncbi:hypothetical protein [Wenyingzhuangia marina]|uniref:Chromosome segregation protein SMC n=1 Tax=Wenyingzhuangia marina TaxID=1195760 RepID=A0A1M5SHT1_9FLAO|nr:hypothetical protein [Wenyingzhuangia marina]GGF62249.1 hypothetical protein GCM10011397_01750 [Wenyingzhuangia marina]SHH37960.1 hypothetical protein SAMN05444281_0314 [Wenyingzhuangia marina]
MKNTKNILIAILAIIIIGFIVYNYKITNENSAYKQSILEEKEALAKELDITLKDLNVNQEQNIAITKDFNNANEKLKGIRNQLNKSKEEIEKLKTKLSNSEENSFKALQTLRASLEGVKINNQFLFKSLDSIKTLNDSLMVTIAVTKSELNAEKLQSEELSLKLSEATKVQISKVEVFAIEEKKSGEIKETNRYKNVNGIQVKYNVLNNKALTNTECDIFYVLKNSDDLIVASNGEFLHKGALKKFTDGTRLILNGETMPVSDIISLQDVELSKGTYTIEFYSLDGLLASESFVLKNSFLGVF